MRSTLWSSAVSRPSSKAPPFLPSTLTIVFHRTTGNNARLAAALLELNASYKDPAGRHIVPDSAKLDSINIHLLRTDLGPLDLLSRVGKNLTYEALLDRSIDYEVAGLRFKVLNLETVIECKEIANRDKDRAALPILRRTLELKRSGDN
jgi:hypothetical protein